MADEALKILLTGSSRINNVTPLGSLKARPRGRLTVQKGEKKKLEGRAGKAKKTKSDT